MSKEITLAAPAKINWLLHVGKLRADGYHEIETIFQAISLRDTIRIQTAREFSFRCNESSIPADERNLVVRAYRLMNSPPVAIELVKRIPAEAGLGGGSSDAAATLRGLSDLFGLPIPSDLALELGSDVPFFLAGNAAYGTGRGEQLQAIPSASGIPLLLGFPRERVSTAEAYRWLDLAHPNPTPVIGFDQAASMMKSGVLEHGARLQNDFEPVVFEKHPALQLIKQRMLQAGAAWSGMTGSGSTIVAAFRNPSARDNAMAKLKGIRVLAAETI